MQSLTTLFRRASVAKHYLAPVIRGPKKKKGDGGGAAEIESNDVLNIFKDKTDPEIKPLAEYPVWLFEMLYFRPDGHTAFKAWMNGIDNDQLQPQDIRQLLNQIQRNKIIAKNKMAVYNNGDIEDERYNREVKIVTYKPEVVEPTGEEEEEEEEEEDDDEPKKRK